MNIEIADRLVELRKKNGFSQEALAEKLGVSRQAVSKWERAEASPDTDNLIMLSRIYHVSLDELLGTKEFSASSEEAAPYEELSPEREPKENGGQEIKSPAVVLEKPGNIAMSVWLSCLEGLPLGFIILVAYLMAGCFWDLWHPGWLLFFLIPIVSSLKKAFKKRNAKYFDYPVLVVLVYLILGMAMDIWHPGWLVFLTIPIYYPLVKYIQRLIHEQDEDLGL